MLLFFFSMLKIIKTSNLLDIPSLLQIYIIILVYHKLQSEDTKMTFKIILEIDTHNTTQIEIGGLAVTRLSIPRRVNSLTDVNAVLEKIMSSLKVYIFVPQSQGKREQTNISKFAIGQAIINVGEQVAKWGGTVEMSKTTGKAQYTVRLVCPDKHDIAKEQGNGNG